MINFKYHIVDDDGHEVGLRARKGYVDRNELALHQIIIPHKVIQQTLIVGDRLILRFSDTSTLDDNLLKHVYSRILTLKIGQAQPRDIKREIDYVVSRLQAKNHKQELERHGEADTFKTAKCPNCECAVDLSGFKLTPYTYCPFCEVIFTTKTMQVITDSLTHSICEECHTYGEIHGYLDFVFYFLLIAYGYRYKTVYLCPTCASRMANRLFLINVLFIVGLFPAVYTKIRALQRKGKSKLNHARDLSLNGRFTEAEPIYRQLYETQHEHPAILMNEAIGHLYGNDPEGGINLLQRSLKVCGNYQPTLYLVQSLASQNNEDPFIPTETVNL